MEIMKTVEKPWGREEWYVLNDKYCLKRLYVNGQHRLSEQYHVKKKETMFLESGVASLLCDERVILMKCGVPYTINPKEVHQIRAHSDSVILEVSTPEIDDVVRLADDYGRMPSKGS
jgi:mannose-1-phosphate guanylyltransferase